MGGFEEVTIGKGNTFGVGLGLGLGNGNYFEHGQSRHLVVQCVPCTLVRTRTLYGVRDVTCAILMTHNVCRVLSLELVLCTE